MAISGVLLDCEHTVYFKTYPPMPGDQVWCFRCENYQHVPKHDRERGTYYPLGDWYAYQHARVKTRGVCNKCGHEFIARFHQVRSHMEKHERLQCQLELMPVVIPLPPNSPPPF